MTQANDAQSACSTDDNSFSADAAAGLSSSCQQMQKAGYRSGADKSSAANTCMQKWNACYTTCNGGAKTYASGSNAGTFSSYAATCYALKDRVDTLLQASNDSTSAASAGQKCDDNASSSPSSSAGGDNSKDKDAQKDDQRNAECTANPSAAGCAAQGSQYAAAEKGTAQFGDGNAAKGSADVADTSAVSANPGGALGNQSSGASGGAKNGTIPNNTGGGISGGGGSPSMGGGGGFAGALSALASKITDIEKGFLGGGASTTPATETSSGAPDSPGAPADESSRDPASIKTADLARYLPGHDRAPPPPTVTMPNQFHPREVNLFSRISARMQEKCTLGELFDCQ